MNVDDLKPYWTAISKIKDFAVSTPFVQVFLQSEEGQKSILLEHCGIARKDGESSETLYDILETPVPNLRIIYNDNTQVCHVSLICKCGECLAIAEAVGNDSVSSKEIMGDEEGAMFTVDSLKLAQVIKNPLDAFVYSCPSCDMRFRAFIDKQVQGVMMMYSLSFSFIGMLEESIKKESDQ